MSEHKTPMIDAVEMEIVMHRNAHFDSNFNVMLEYYDQHGVGAMPDFTIAQIKKLKKLEEELGSDLSDNYLPDAAKNMVLTAQKLYQKLRDVYGEEENDPLAIELSDLILAEEEIPEKEMEALVKHGDQAVPLLIELLRADSFYDPLFPGYGRSPIFVARALASIKDERAIAPLFEALGQDNFFTDEEIFQALCSFGDQAQDFLLERLGKKPFSKDNEYAAIVLNAFPETPAIACVSLDLLESEEVLNKKNLATYLIFNCACLKEQADRARFSKLAKERKLLRELRGEMDSVMRSWQKGIE